MLFSIMRAHQNLLKIAALWSLAAMACGQAAGTGPAPGTAEKSWRLGAAFGYGQRTNPLIQSDDIPVLVDLDIAWFGKRWFFDNGDLGFTMHEGARSTTSLVARVNSDRMFFAKTNTRYVQLGYAANGVPPAQLINPAPVEPPDRDYAIELGVESLIDGDWGAATLRAFHDVSGTHRGYELAAYYSRRFTTGRFSFEPTVGASYKSDRLNNYYWGVHPDEASIALPEYHAGAGLNFEGGLVANYYFSRNLRFAMSVNYERLSDEIVGSPLTEENHVLAYFSGLAWTF